MLEVLTKGCEPTIGTEFSACIDLYAAHDLKLHTGETNLIGLGVKIDLQELASNLFFDDVPIEEWDQALSAIECKVRVREWKKFLSSHYIKLSLRSSMAMKGYRIANSEGIIDLDYPDEIKLIVEKPVCLDDLTENSSDCLCHVEIYTEVIDKGAKIAQAMICEHKTNLFGVRTKEKRIGGLGSTDA